MPHSNAITAGSVECRLTLEEATKHLFDVRRLARHIRARVQGACAHELGEHEFAEQRAGRQVEERGHERWADEDLDRLRSSPGSQCSPALLDLIRLDAAIVERDRTHYLIDARFAEHLRALLGPSWRALPEARRGIPSSAAGVVAEHAELERGRSAEGLEAVRALVAAPAELGPMREVLRESFGFLDRFGAGMPASCERREEAPCSSSSPA